MLIFLSYGAGNRYIMSALRGGRVLLLALDLMRMRSATRSISAVRVGKLTRAR